MKKNLALVAALMLSVGVAAQSDELKTLKKVYDKEAPNEKDIVNYKAAVATLDANSGLSEGDRVYTNFYKAMLPLLEFNNEASKPENASKMQLIAMKYMNVKNIQNLGTAMAATVDFEKKSGKKVYTDDIEETAKNFGPIFIQYVDALEKQNNYKDAATVLYSTYLMDRNQQDYLYYAANYAINAKEYDTALKYYYELKDLKYTGEKTLYTAKNLASGNDDSFATKADRDKMIALKSHSSPKEVKEPSKRGEIFKNIALILIEQGKDAEAKAALAEAKRANPDDTGIILAEADMYYRLKDMESYKKAIAEVLAKNPNDADMLYNLGVVTMQSGNNAEAEQYFNKALAVNPNYVNAYINLSSLKLAGEKALVDEMNKLGTSKKDMDRYDVLKKQRDGLLREAIVPLEKAYQIKSPDPNIHRDVLDNLISLYSFFEMKDKVNALKVERDALPAN